MLLRLRPATRHGDGGSASNSLGVSCDAKIRAECSGKSEEVCGVRESEGVERVHRNPIRGGAAAGEDLRSPIGGPGRSRRTGGRESLEDDPRPSLWQMG
jgi:hypothetical protein